MSYDGFHPDKKRIYRLINERASQGNKFLSANMLDPMLEPVREDIPGLEAVAIMYNYNAKVRIKNDEGEKYFEEPRYGIDPLEIIVTNPDYFDIFRYEWLSGSPASLNEPFAVALTDDKARLYFGDLPVEQYIGKELTYGNDLRMTVASVVKSWKKNTDIIFTDFISYASIPGSELKDRIDMKSWGMWSSTTQVYVKLLPGVEQAAVEKRFEAFSVKYLPHDPNMKFRFLLQPLADLHFNTVFRDGYSRQAHLPTLYGLMAIAIFILVIAACNFINLSTAQSLQRTKEIGVRKVFGGKRGGLITQFLSETFLITFLGAILSLFIARLFINAFHSYMPKDLSIGLAQPFIWLSFVAIIVCTTLIAGLYPARLMSGAAPVTMMKSGSQRNSAKNLLRKSLIVFQFTISLILLICTMVIGDQLHFMLNKDMGFTKDAILNIRIRGNREVLADNIRKFPYVEMVSIHTAPPAAKGHNGTSFKFNNEGEEREVRGSIEFCDENFIPLYGLQLVAGRNLLPSPYMREFVINESFARELGFDDPQDAVGQFIESGQFDRLPENVPTPAGPRLMQIVGVAADFNATPLYNKINPMAISATTQARNTMSVKLTIAGKSAETMKQIMADMEKTWKEINPYERLEMTFYDDSIAAFYEKEQQTAQIINAAMLMGIFISCMGLFGLVLFTTKQRTKEIGIRKVLGASISDILALLSGGFVKLVLIAALIASPIAWYAMNKWLAGFAYHVPIRWWLFVLASLFALFIALATISLQAIKAATADPVKAIKSE
jgi:ABC-type antimicrobial peptide transport system permease subunit